MLIHPTAPPRPWTFIGLGMILGISVIEARMLPLALCLVSVILLLFLFREDLRRQWVLLMTFGSVFGVIVCIDGPETIKPSDDLSNLARIHGRVLHGRRVVNA